jgi:hypothetical protein
MKKFNLTDLVNIQNHYKKETGTIDDIFDGELYQSLLNSEEGGMFLNQKAFTFMLNTDGISRCTKSKQTIWPIILVINEIPQHLRYCIDNVIIAGS